MQALADSLHRRLLSFYQAHNPDKLKDMEYFGTHTKHCLLILNTAYSY
jgi:hypothetical protein